MNECIRGVIAQYTAQGLYSQRELVSDLIKKNLQERCRPFHIQIDDLSLMDMHFSRFFEQAVEEKQIAQQQAERAKFTVEKAVQEKKSTIIKAEADAQSIMLIGEQIKRNPGKFWCLNN
jgi:prohibitin 2